MLKIIICDDDREYAEFEKNTLHSEFLESGVNKELDIEIFTNAKDVVNYKGIKEADVCFLDIDMGDESGFELAGKLASMLKQPRIVFVTSHENLVYDAFDYMPVAFLRKRNFIKELKRLIPRLLIMLELNEEYIVFEGHGRKAAIKPKDIHYVNVYDHMLEINCNVGIVQIRDSLNKYTDKLKKYGFIELGRSSWVNPEHIIDIKGSEVVLDGCLMPFSPRKRKQICDKYSEYISRRKK